ncbi:polyubiquitin-like [Herrania umbratica]|uniref:Polyubiquitin-like n=1 Tax=Herrania umbratica TaxID=108875 RepID=A0A6J1AV69_9ROSI|nr:polyubiquitin-like [Herrania umbratica]
MKPTSIQVKISETIGNLKAKFKIRLYVKVPSDHKIMAVKVKSSDTIQKIKSVVLAKKWIQGKEYSLYHAGKLLEDNRTLSSLNIPGKVTLQMVSTPPNESRLENFRTLAYYDIEEDAILKMVPAEYQIFVMTWCGTTVTVYVNQFETIAE